MNGTAAPRRTRPARVGLLATAMLLAVAMVFTATRARSDARARQEVLDRGEADRHFHAFTERFPPFVRPSSPALEDFVRARRDEGLLAAVVLAPDGTVLAQGGAPSAVAWRDELRPGPSLRRVQGRLRLAHVLPPAGPPPFPGGRFPPPPGGGPPPPPPRIVLELQPSASEALLADATRSFHLSVGAAAVLALVSVLLYRQLARAEAQESRYQRQERLAGLGMMSAVIAHEIRNPLAALKGHAQLLAERVDGGSAKAQAGRVVRAAERLESLVNDLLEFVREGPLAREEVDPAELLHAVVTELAPDAALDLDEAPPRWSLDRARVQRALTNLVVNALQAGGPAGLSAAVFVHHDGALVFAVRDRGPGFPDGDLERVFEPFVTTRARGVGLGLALVRRVAELHGGRAFARNRQDGGAEVRLVLQ